MTVEQVIESMDNAWRALNVMQANQPDDSARHAANMVARIIDAVISEIRKSQQKEEEASREGQITIEEWIAFLEEE